MTVGSACVGPSCQLLRWGEVLVSCDLDGTAIIGVHMGERCYSVNSACPFGEFIYLNITIIYLYLSCIITARFPFHSHSLCCFALMLLECRDKKQ